MDGMTCAERLKAWKPIPTAVANLSADEERRRLNIYHSAATLEAAARDAGVRYETMRTWVRLRGLPAKGRVTRTLLAARDAEWLQAYQETRSDGQAGKRLGIDRDLFGSWRHRMGLPAKMKSFEQMLTKEQRIERVRLYRQSRDLQEFASRIGVSVAWAENWIARHGLPHPAWHARHKAFQKQFGRDRSWFREYYERTDCDLAGADRLGVSLSEFRQWRMAEGLPPKVPTPASSPPRQAKRNRNGDEASWALMSFRPR
ncbi:MAG: hypothetical protein LC620_07600 [Halobacteriales archaeon]|nr:hypothetical protein [Halobacteriales archaeon]